ncbi:MAG TPA: type VI secretion system baseplate subunit TssK [Pyrinomonadaceae bacterium]|nr:type VI secretion system baseplate subunit TssK [Pyrinomonadaceae bacterium]
MRRDDAHAGRAHVARGRVVYTNMEAHEIPESIQWHEGLLLTPQHFQQMSLRQESLLQYVAGAIAPFGWGVRRFGWDAAALAGGLLRVIRLDAVMPDGLVVTYGARGGGEPGVVGDLSADLSPHAERLKGGGGVTVYLAVAARDSEQGAGGRDGRYLSVEGDPVADEQTGDGALVIPRLRPHLKLVAGEAPGKNHVSFPLARVRHNGSAFTLEGFIPPALSVGRDSALGRMCSESARHIREKAMFLADRLRGASGGGARAVLDRDTEALLRCLLAPLPQLEAVLATDVTHPFVVYLAFCAAAGQVATLGGRLDPPLFRPYDHNDLGATFGEVLEYIRGKVEAGAASSFTVHAFTYEDGVFRIDFDPAWATKRLVLGMRARPGMTEAELSRWGAECVIGSEPLMDSLRRNRVRGARRSLVERDQDLVPPRDVLLFSLAPDPEFVEPGQVLQIFNAGVQGQETRPSAIVMYVRQTG